MKVSKEFWLELHGIYRFCGLKISTRTSVPRPLSACSPPPPLFLLCPSHTGLLAVVQTCRPRFTSGPLHMQFPLPTTLPRSLYDLLIIHVSCSHFTSPGKTFEATWLRYPVLVTVSSYPALFSSHSIYYLKLHNIANTYFFVYHGWLLLEISGPWKQSFVSHLGHHHILSFLVAY